MVNFKCTINKTFMCFCLKFVSIYVIIWVVYPLFLSFTRQFRLFHHFKLLSILRATRYL